VGPRVDGQSFTPIMNVDVWSHFVQTSHRQHIARSTILSRMGASPRSLFHTRCGHILRHSILQSTVPTSPSHSHSIDAVIHIVVSNLLTTNCHSALSAATMKHTQAGRSVVHALIQFIRSQDSMEMTTLPFGTFFSIAAMRCRAVGANSMWAKLKNSPHAYHVVEPY